MENNYTDPAALILIKCADLIEKKSKDYNGGTIKRDDYAIFGRQSHMQAVWTKVLRLRSLMDNPTPNFESLNDTLMDLANYSAIWCDWENRNADSK